MPLMRCLCSALLCLLLPALVASAGPRQNTQREFDVIDAADADVRFENGDVVNCASRLQVRCQGSPTWTTFERGTAQITLECKTTAPGIEYRARDETAASIAWACPLADASAPLGAKSSSQEVRVSGTLSTCQDSTLSAQSTCLYDCSPNEC